MREAVSDILEERAQITDGISRMMIASLIAHGVLLSSLIFTPSFWTGTTQKKENVMTISLGGVEGPESGGMTPLSARPVQQVAPPEARPQREPPPAPKAPEMTAPEPTAKPAPRTTKPVEKPAETTSRKPTTGAEVKSGTAVAETRSPAQVPFGGLSTGGGGDGATFDVKNFCCPAYLQTMRRMIHDNWQRNQGVPGRVVVQLVVQRDGRITDVQIVESGGQFLDIASRRLMATIRQFPPLPREYPESSFTIQIGLTYLR